LIARATVLALQDLKKMNSLYQDGQLTEFDEVHLGIATSLEDGLVVPVVKDAHQKTIGNLAKEIKELTGKARNGEAGGDLLSGSTFTITNLGASGIEYFTPILNTPETGILGVGAFQDELILTEKGKVKSVKKIPFSVTFDHQIVDGATAADFLTILTKYIESPYLLVL
jgi:pyruvate dehydrogenase E2 component (dihydrolipoamide acetyltransferase)